MEHSPEIILIDVIFLVCREQNLINRKSKMYIASMYTVMYTVEVN